MALDAKTIKEEIPDKEKYESTTNTRKPKGNFFSISRCIKYQHFYASVGVVYESVCLSHKKKDFLY